jgi:hypothetical protein
MLRSEQLVGTALVVMIKEELTGAVRNVEGASKKVRSFFLPSTQPSDIERSS